MAKGIKSATKGQIQAVDRAQGHLRAALEALKEADCPRAADKVRAAIRSCGGAKRHAENRSSRTGRDEVEEGVSTAA